MSKIYNQLNNDDEDGDRTDGQPKGSWSTLHELELFCRGEFILLNARLKELFHFRDQHEVECKQAKEELREQLVQVQIEQAKFAVYAIIGGCIGSAVIAALISEIFQHSKR